MKKQLLTLSLLLMGVGAFSQSTIWNPHDAAIGDSMGTRWMSAVSASTVWEVGYSRIHTTATSNVFTRTQNGGATFVAGMFMPLSDTNYYSSANISAVNDSVAYIPCYFIPASGRAGIVKKTVDRGVTWTIACDTNTMFMGTNNFPDWAHFYTENHGLVLGDPNGGNFEIWKTYNGGTSWTRIPNGNITPTPPAGEYGITDVFTSFGNRHLWFGTNHGGGTTTASHIYRSNDTGNTWIGSTIPGINYGVNGIAFRDTMHGLAWGYNTSSATAPFVLKRTVNGGATWATIPTHNNVGIFDISEVPGRNAFVSVGLDSSHAQYITSVTYDDGITWTVLEGGIQEAQRMVKINMLDSAHGWAGSFSDTVSIPAKGGMNDWMGPVINLACPLSITSSAASICSGNSATLTASGTSTYTWSANAGSVMTNTASVSPMTTTVFTVTGAYLSCTNTQTISLTVNTTPTVSAVPASTVICFWTAPNPNNTQIIASGATTYNWIPATGLSSTTSATVTANPTVTTTYTVTGNNSGCTNSQSLTITVAPCTGVALNVAEIASIFPNPSNGNITIDFGKATAGTKVVITDMIGNNVFQSAVNEGTTKLHVDLSSMPKGMYLINVSNGSGSSIKKLIVE